MTAPQTDALQGRQRSTWVRLRTLVILRWLAIAGQGIAILVASYVLGLQLPIGLISMTIGASVLANLFSTALFPQTKRLSEVQAFLMLLFDLLQLSILLLLTGGLNNPFAVLLLVPVTIAATFLNLRGTIALGLIAMVVISGLGWFSIALILPDGAPLLMPQIFRIGFWSALMIGVVFLGGYARQITGELHAMGDALFATQMALAREQKLTDLGGVVAAAAHELGTPLATIKLVSSELSAQHKGDPELTDDLDLITQQTDRCRDILRSMGRAGKEDRHLLRTPLEALIREAALPHLERGKMVDIVVSDDTDFPTHQPVVQRRPEIIHGLRNLIQNAVDFASSTVRIESTWSADTVELRIADDGEGFPASVIGRLGNPFIRQRASEENKSTRPGYEGMGLGLFIAKTLLERSGATVRFANGGSVVAKKGDGGALVVVTWPRDAIDPTGDRGFGALGENPNFGD